MSYWRCLLVLFSLFNLVNCSNDLLLVKNHLGDHLCITNSSYALAWIDPTGKDVPTNQVGYSRYSCDIGENDDDTPLWKISQSSKFKNSLDANDAEIILDRRWERFETVSIGDYSKTVARISNINFELPISIRTGNKTPFHIFLCDEATVEDAKCYWINLYEWNATLSVIRKCAVTKIPNDLKPKNGTDCYKGRDVRNENGKAPYLNADEWNHFKIIKNEKTIAFTGMDDDKPILEFTDYEELIQIRFVMMQKTAGNALIKVHNYEYLEYTEIYHNETLGPSIKDRLFICISFFFRQCENCVTKFKYGSNTEETYRHKTKKWSEINMCSYNSEGGELQLFITTSFDSTEGRPFWHIDGVGAFSSSLASRGISTTSQGQNFKCQLLTETPKFIALERPTFDPLGRNDCSPETVGPYCYPCRQFPIDDYSCENSQVCTKIENRNTICTCSPGYVGESCDQKCSEGTYGQGCTQKCGHCEIQPCDGITGICSEGRCDEDFTGGRCEKSPGAKLETPPIVLYANYTSCSVRIVNSNNLPASYFFLLQFREFGPQGHWMDFRPLRPINYNNPINITNLKITTKYSIRAVVCDKTGVATYDRDYVKTNVCRTTCKTFQDEDVEIKNTSATTVWFKVHMTEIHCPFWIAKVDNKIAMNKTGQYVVTQLEAYHDYNISLFDQSNAIVFKKTFKTKEGIPSKVIVVNSDAVNSTAIALKWEPPLYPRGDIQFYAIEYKQKAHKACKDDVAEHWERVETTERSHTIGNLVPYSNYIFTISASNSLYEGDLWYGSESTERNPMISDGEIPKILSIQNDTRSATSVLISFAKIDCEIFQGPLYIRLTVNCENDWCPKSVDSTYTDYLPKGRKIKTNLLIPYSNYTCEYVMCRDGNSNNCKTENRQQQKFTTATDRPNAVRDLKVYSKDAKYVSLRWRPPYPPTGILSGYHLKYKCTDCYNPYENSEWIPAAQACRLWTNFVCAKITKDIFERYHHKITISAVNVEPKKISGTPTEITAKAEKGVPEPPYDLSILWDDYNNLTVYWTHPNVTNGDLVYFEIFIGLFSSANNISHTKPVTESGYQLRYNETYDNIPSSSYFRVSMLASNGDYRSTLATLPSNYSPPSMPKLMQNPKFETTNSSILIHLILKKSADVERLDQSKLFLLISPKMPHRNIEQVNMSLLDGTKFDLHQFDVLRSFNTKNEPNEIRLNVTDCGENHQKCRNENKAIIDYPVKVSNINYTLKIVLVNSYEGIRRFNSYNFTVTSGRLAPDSSGVENNSLLILLLLLFVIPVIILIIWKRRLIGEKLNSKRQQLRDFNLTRWTRNFCNEDTEVVLVPKSSSNCNTMDGTIPLLPLAKNRRKSPLSTPDPPDISFQNETVHSKSVKITDLEQYIKECLDTGELERQHSLFPRGQTKPWSHGELKVNKAKNRYNNLIAYDHSRVILEKLPGDEHSDYINANYIHGYKMARAYIATQGPKPATVYDFWRMIWQENVQHIVMLANLFEGGKKKVAKYWPDINASLDFNEITVQFVSATVHADYEFRIFNVIRNGETRKIEQLHYTTWPDHGVPLYSESLVPFLQKMLKIPLSQKSPVVIHCSAGVGRTGTIILCDICLRMAAREGCVDALRHLQTLRNQRSNMVDNVEQYKLAHLVIFETLFGMKTSFPCNDIGYALAKLKNTDGFRLQMRYLKDTAWQDQAMKSVGQPDEEAPIYQQKNRFQHIVPEIQGRVFLCHYPPGDETSSYINAITVDGFQTPGRFIATQQPLPGTLGDFWRLVEENRISVIVNLNEIDPSDETCCKFWPGNGETMTPTDFISITRSSSKESEFCVSVDLNVDVKNDESLNVTVFSLKDWRAGDVLPPSHEHFLEFWEQCGIVSRRCEKVLLTCHDGSTGCGLYAALCFLVEKIKLEQVCDVCQAVRNVRHNREQFISQEEQFEFLYELAEKYINCFQSYANFL